MNRWAPITFDAMWRRAVADRPERVFLRFEGSTGAVTEWRYGEFDRIVEGATERLAEAGVAPGDSVHVALTNSPTFVAVWLAVVRLGAWIVPSDPMSPATELTEHVSRTKPLVGFCATERADTYRSIPGELLPPTVIDVDESDTALRWLNPMTPADRQRPSISDRAAVMFTSGTTGRPKGVEITQANYAFAGDTMASACDLTADDRQLVVLPMFHANAQYYSFASAIAVGASVALMPAFSASRFVEQAAAHGATCASLFAGPIRMILARGGPLLRSPATQAARGCSLAGARSLAVADGSTQATSPPLRLRHCWFAQNLTPDQYDTISDWLGCRPRQLYGMTETIPAVLTDERDDPRCDTMGYVTEGCVVDVEDGEIIVGGEPGITLFAGYLDDPDTTANSFRAGWFITGDRAHRDQLGRYAFEGRRSDVLKVAGENVSTVEVEHVLASHPGVADVAVIGAPDPVRDEVPIAIVVPAAGAGEHAPLRTELERWCAERLGKAKRPRDYRFVDELPRTSVGKIKKYQLLRSPATQAASDRSLAGARSLASEDAIQRRKDTEMTVLTDSLLSRLDESVSDVSTASTLPAELYTSPDVLEFEWEAVFANEWLCAGRAERIPNPGDWFTVTYGNEPIIVARDKSGAINAMSAVCQHRAMQVCEGSGTSTTFKCPYHHWTYSLEGRLLGAPAMERTTGFDKSEFGLPRLTVELWQGFVFVNMDADAAPLGPTLARYEPFLDHYDLTDAVCPGTFTLTDLPWNWKVMFENFNDGYHANRLHQYVQDFCPSGMTAFPIDWADESNVIFRTAGYTHLDGGFNATHHAIMPVFPRLTDEERMRSTFALVPPTLCFGTAPDQCFFFLVRPTGPETIDVEIGYIFHPSALEDPLFEHKLKLSDVGVQVFVQQDQDATTKVQRGLRSRYAPRGRYSWQEESHVEFNRWLVQRYRKHWPTLRSPATQAASDRSVASAPSLASETFDPAGEA